MMMQMWFYWGCECTFIFKNWKIEAGNTMGFLVACVAVAAFCFIGPVVRSAKDNMISKANSDKDISKPVVIAL